MLKQSQIIYFNPTVWSFCVAKIIHKKIMTVLTYKSVCTLMLTGGRSAEKIYATWSEFPEFQKLSGVHFYFTDERCVAPDSLDSNYGMVMRTLFKNNIPLGCSLFRIEADNLDNDFAADHYAKKLPHSIDVMLLGLGDDGHIASLFPRNAALRETSRQVLFTTAPQSPCNRVTITPVVIHRAKFIYMLASGLTKSKALSQAMLDSNDFDSLPVRLVPNADWLIDLELKTQQMNKNRRN